MDNQDALEYIQKVRNGDHAAFAFLVNSYKKMAYNIALRVLERAEEAEDAAQESFIKAYQQLRQFEGKAKFSTWLYTIVYRTALAKSREIKFRTFSITDKFKENYLKDKKEPIIFSEDEFIRPETTKEVLAKLRPAFKKDGSVTAGNSSGLNDGAAATIIASEEAVKKYNLKPIAKIVSSAVVGVEPRIMGIGPVEASNKALEKAGLKMEDMDIIELNEAFASQALACIREWGLKDDDPRINPNGGSIAIGHPLGVTGTRIAYSAAMELQLQKKKYALITMCVGVGQGYAVIIENVNI